MKFVPLAEKKRNMFSEDQICRIILRNIMQTVNKKKPPLGGKNRISGGDDDVHDCDHDRDRDHGDDHGSNHDNVHDHADVPP